MVKSRTPCELAEIGYERLFALFEGPLRDECPRILFAIGGQLTRRLLHTSRKVSRLAFMDVTSRVARTLLDLCQEPDALSHPLGHPDPHLAPGDQPHRRLFARDGRARAQAARGERDDLGQGQDHRRVRHAMRLRRPPAERSAPPAIPAGVARRTGGRAAAVAILLGQLGYPCARGDAARRIATLLEDPTQSLVVAEFHGDLCGLLALDTMYYLPLGAPTCRITSLIVDEAHRATASAALLLREAERRARACGAVRIELTSAAHRHRRARVLQGQRLRRELAALRQAHRSRPDRCHRWRSALGASPARNLRRTGAPVRRPGSSARMKASPTRNALHAGRAHARDVARGVRMPLSVTSRRSSGTSVAQTQGGVERNLEAAQVAVVDPDQRRSALQRAVAVRRRRALRPARPGRSWRASRVQLRPAARSSSAATISRMQSAPSARAS